MPITPPPKKNTIEKCISKGGRVANDNSSEWVMINIRLPKNWLDLIDEKVEECVGMSRNSWILQNIKKILEL